MGVSRTKSNSRSTSHYTSKRTPEELNALLDDISFEPDAAEKCREVHQCMHSSKCCKRNVTAPKQSSNDDEDVWSPTPYAAFKLLVSARFAAALWTTISDCDETFNYWEPTHYLLYGKGFQTWEYSPEYALRSYTYLLVHAVPAKIYDYFLKPNPLLVFFLIRCLLALASAATEVYLYRAIRKSFGGSISRLALMTSLFAPGMFISSSAFLPSSFSSYMTALAIGAWLTQLQELAIFAIAVSALLSWPFAALTGVFIALDIVIIRRKLILFTTWCIISLLVVLVPIVLIDSSHYNKWVIAPWNIVKYNILSSKGPALYGTEPWTFYIANGFLNFSLVFLMCLCSPILLMVSNALENRPLLKEKFFILGTAFVWLAVFIIQPHKEERFLFPIFPLIPVCGAIGIDSLQHILLVGFYRTIELFLVGTKKSHEFGVWLLRFPIMDYIKAVGFSIVVVGNLLGCSRMVALHYGYRAPFDVFFNLQREGIFQKYEAEIGDEGSLTLCYGKEWYRFPSSFFLPSTKWDMRFIQSDFKGQLPNLYPAFDPDGTTRIPQNMNDLNIEEPSRYINASECDFLVDLIDESRISEYEPNYAQDTHIWTVISEQDFINAGDSHPAFRSFYVPFLSQHFTKYNRYVFLEKRKRRAAAETAKKQRKPEREKFGREFVDDLDDDFL